MAVVDQDPIGGAVGNGVTTIFPFNYYVAEDSDLVVQLDSVDKTLNVDYTVVGAGNESGGQITFAVAPASGVQVTHYRDTQLIRSNDYQTTGDLPADVLNLDLDRLWLALQEIFSGGKGSPNAVRAPSGETLVPLPKASQRVLTQLLFDAQGQPFVAAPVSGSAADVLLQLANVNDPTKNASLLHYKLPVAGAQDRTARDRFINERWIEDLIPAGATTHHAYFSAAAALGGVWHVGAGPFVFDAGGGCVGTDGFKLICHGTKITHATTTTPTFQFIDKSDWGIFGSLEITGNGIGTGTAVGIQRVGGRRFEVHNVVCKNIDGHGFREVNNISTSPPRGDRGNWINCRAIGCRFGREDVASDNTEYNFWVNFTATGCTIGNITAAGNNRFIGGNIVDNTDGGIWLKGLPNNNNLHGAFVGVAINHNGPNSGGYNIRCTDVANGEIFTGCSVYADNAGTGYIWLERCQGIMFTAGILDASIFCDSPTGYNMFSGNFCPDSVNTVGKYGPLGPNDPGVTKAIVARNFARTGMWKYNDPGGPLFMRASRSGTQSITSATDTTLIFNAESYDTRAAHDTTTGKFTAPWLGNYRVTGSARITAASGIPAGGGAIILKIGGVSQFFAPMPAQSASQAIANFSFTAGVAAGTTIEVCVNITGTTLVFDIGQLTIEELT